MKIINKRNKTFKIIPEANKVIGNMNVKTFSQYADYASIPFLYRSLITNAIDLSNDDFSYINATALCDERDEFDVNAGLDVCSAKLELKNHLRVARWYDRAHRRLIEAANIAYKLCKKHVDKAQSIEEDLAKTYGRGNDL